MKRLKIFSIGFLMFIISMTVGIKFINAANKIATAFPDKITASYTDIFTVDGVGINIYKKQYDTGAKAICTRFWKNAPAGTCSAVAWNTDATKNKKIATAMGAMLTKARSISNIDGASLTWDSYFFLEMAMNNFLYNYNGKSDLNNVSRMSKWSNVTSNSMYKSIYAAGTTAYENFGKTSISLNNASIVVSNDRKNVTATINVTCYDSKGKATTCSTQYKDTLTITGTSNGNSVSKVVGPKCEGSTTNNCVEYVKDTSNGITYKYTYKATFDEAFDTSTAVTASFKIKNQVSYGVAQNYDCGNNYQTLTPNSVKTIYEYDEANKSISTETGSCSFKITKLESGTNAVLTGAKFELYQGGYLVSSAITNLNGEAIFDNLSDGTYTYKEVEAPMGFVLDSTERTVEISSTNCNPTTQVMNNLENGSLTIYKTDNENKAVVGAKIKVYTITSTGSNGNYENPEIGDYDETSGGDYTKEDDNNYQFNYLRFDANGNYNPNGEFDYFITTDTPKVIEGLTIGRTYYVDEESVPENSDYAIKVGADSAFVEKSQNYDVKLINNHSNFKISKQDITSKSELKGATLQLFDSRGIKRYEWVSNDKPQEIIGLEDGDYTLVETQAPKGYTMSESINFTIENGKVKNDADNTVVMYDKFVAEVPDTFTTKNIITMIIGLVLVAAGTGAIVYEYKKKTA